MEQKWIFPLAGGIRQLPDEVIRTLTGKIKTLSEKYAATYSAIESEIHETESELSALIDELDGSEYDRKGLSEFRKLLKGE